MALLSRGGFTLGYRVSASPDVNRLPSAVGRRLLYDAPITQQTNVPSPRSSRLPKSHQRPIEECAAYGSSSSSSSRTRFLRGGSDWFWVVRNRGEPG